MRLSDMVFGLVERLLARAFFGKESSWSAVLDEACRKENAADEQAYEKMVSLFARYKSLPVKSIIAELRAIREIHWLRGWWSRKGDRFSMLYEIFASLLERAVEKPLDVPASQISEMLGWDELIVRDRDFCCATLFIILMHCHIEAAAMQDVYEAVLDARYKLYGLLASDYARSQIGTHYYAGLAGVIKCASDVLYRITGEEPVADEGLPG